MIHWNNGLTLEEAFVFLDFFFLCNKGMTLQPSYFVSNYRNFPKFSDRQVWANSADPDQTAPRSSLIRIYTVCHSVCIVWTRYSMVEPHSSTFRVITTKFLGVRIFRKFTVVHFLNPDFIIMLYSPQSKCKYKVKNMKRKSLTELFIYFHLFANSSFRLY